MTRNLETALTDPNFIRYHSPNTQYLAQHCTQAVFDGFQHGSNLEARSRFSMITFADNLRSTEGEDVRAVHIIQSAVH